MTRYITAVKERDARGIVAAVYGQITGILAEPYVLHSPAPAARQVGSWLWPQDEPRELSLAHLEGSR